MRLTEAQRRTLEYLAPRNEPGLIHSSTARILKTAGFIRRHETSGLTDWWEITPAGRSALQEGQK